MGESTIHSRSLENTFCDLIRICILILLGFYFSSFCIFDPASWLLVLGLRFTVLDSLGQVSKNVLACLVDSLGMNP